MIWDEYFTTDVLVRNYLGRNDRGDPSYGSARKIKCRVEFRRANVINSVGETVVSEIKIYSASPIAAGSLVTIDGAEWPVVSCGPKAGLDGVVDHYEMRA